MLSARIDRDCLLTMPKLYTIPLRTTNPRETSSPKIPVVFLAHYHDPTHHAAPPSPTVIPKCHASAHAIANRNFGLNTVQIKRCCLSAVQATMTDASITPVQNVNSAKCSVHALLFFLSSRLFSSLRAISFKKECSCAIQSALCSSEASIYRCVLPCEPKRRMPARDQYTGPAQLDRKTSRPTAATL
jgi:hypothetical protein